MRFESPIGAPPSAAHTVGGEAPHARVEEAIDAAERSEFGFEFGPARGILNAVAIGAGAWMIIFATVALTRAIFFS